MAAVAVLVAIHVAAALDLHDHVRGESVHDRGADAVQTAGHLVHGVAEFAARVQDRVDDARGRDSLGRMNVHRNAAAVVKDRYAAVLLKSDVDLVAVAREVLVDTVVENLPHKVMETLRAGRTDVHTGTLANGLEPFENDDLTAIVFCHAIPSSGRCDKLARGLYFVPTSIIKYHILRFLARKTIGNFDGNKRMRRV